MVVLKHFSEGELNKLTPGCSLSDMDEEFMIHLDSARDLAGIPFVLTSAYRSKSWELSHGRSGTSAHTSGHAVDISCKDSFSRERIVSALMRVGFNRIGISSTFIHVDDSLLPCHPQHVLWLYK